MSPKVEDVQAWLFKIGLPARWHPVTIAGIGIVVALATVLPILEAFDLLPPYQREPSVDPKEVGNPAAHTAPIKPSIDDAPQTSINDNTLPCGNLGDFNLKDGTHQREAWNLLEKTLGKMQREKKKDSINMRLIEEARHDWDKEHTREALLKFRAGLGCNLVSKDREASPCTSPSDYALKVYSPDSKAIEYELKPLPDTQEITIVFFGKRGVVLRTNTIVTLPDVLGTLSVPERAMIEPPQKWFNFVVKDSNACERWGLVNEVPLQGAGNRIGIDDPSGEGHAFLLK